MSFRHCFDTREIPILRPFPKWQSASPHLAQFWPRSRLLPLSPFLPWGCGRHVITHYLYTASGIVYAVQMWTIKCERCPDEVMNGFTIRCKGNLFFDTTIQVASDIDIQDLRYFTEPNFGCLRVSNTKYHSRYQISACWCFACVWCRVIVVFFVVDRILKYELHTYLSSALILSLSRSK